MTRPGFSVQLLALAVAALGFFGAGMRAAPERRR